MLPSQIPVTAEEAAFIMKRRMLLKDGLGFIPESRLPVSNHSLLPRHFLVRGDQNIWEVFVRLNVPEEELAGKEFVLANFELVLLRDWETDKYPKLTIGLKLLVLRLIGESYKIGGFCNKQGRFYTLEERRRTVETPIHSRVIGPPSGRRGMRFGGGNTRQYNE